MLNKCVKQIMNETLFALDEIPYNLDVVSLATYAPSLSFSVHPTGHRLKWNHGLN